MTLADKVTDLRALLEKATPGPWEHHKQPYDCRSGSGIDDSIFARDKVIFQMAGVSSLDAALIVAMRNALPALLDAAERSEGENAQLREERDVAIQRSLESQILAHKWMVAHDALAAGSKYEFPNPADLPEAVVRANHAEAENAKLRELLQPLALIAEYDIGEDEQNQDLYQPMSQKCANAPLLTVGHLRRAAEALKGDAS